MKHWSILIFTLAPVISFSQKVYSVEYSNQSDLKVFVVEYENQCDLKVYKVDFPKQAKGNKVHWYFVDYPNQSGWRNKSKQHLLY